MSKYGKVENAGHRCRVPPSREVRDAELANGSIFQCFTCNHRWRLAINVGRANWLNLTTEEKRWIGEV